MSRNLQLLVNVETNDTASPESIRAIVDQLINAGLSDASSTLNSGEGDLISAELATSLSISVEVNNDIQHQITSQLAAIGHRFLREYDSEIHDATMRELVTELDQLERCNF